MSKTDKLNKQTAKKKEYLSYYEAMSKGGSPMRDTWTQAQWETATPEKRQLAKSGMSYKKVQRMK